MGYRRSGLLVSARWSITGVTVKERLIMVSAAYVIMERNTSSEAQNRRARFRLIEGGQTRGTAPADIRDAEIPRMGVRVQRTAVREARRPHPEHSGLVCFLAAIAIVVAICVISVIGSSVIESRVSRSIESVPSCEYHVSSGDSLWSIAERHPIEGHSASEVVTWIMERNELESGLIFPGQSLMVPAQSS